MMPTVHEPPAGSTTVRCPIAAYAACRFAPETLVQLRQNPGSLPGATFPASVLKQSDEQTIAGVAAVFEAIQRHHMEQVDFAQWGVVAAPRFLGRAKLATVLSRFAVEGAWGVSPHLIPHRSQHALSGTISQALKIHGPNFGVGGGPDSAAETLLMAGAMLANQQLPGAWVVLTGYDPEFVPAEEEAPAPATGFDCLALALALLPHADGTRGWTLSIGAASPSEGSDTWPPFSLESMVRHLGGDPVRAGNWRLDYGAWATLEFAETAGENCL